MYTQTQLYDFRLTLLVKIIEMTNYFILTLLLFYLFIYLILTQLIVGFIFPFLIDNSPAQLSVQSTFFNHLLIKHLP